MDIQDFLNLPYDIRAQVYYHLNGSFTDIHPPGITDLYDNKTIDVFDAKMKKTDLERALLDKLYPTFAPFIDIFEYDPKIVLQWLKYSVWLRYDAIVLDCFRLNHSYEGTLIGWLDWLDLRTDLKLAYFNGKGVLQTWYSQLEYSNWIIENEPLEISTIQTNYLRLNMEYLKPSRISRVLESFEKKKLLNDIYEARFETTTENANDYRRSQSPYDSEQDDLQITDTTNTSVRLPSYDSATDDPDDAGSSRKKRKKSSTPENGLALIDGGVSEVIRYLRKMKGLSKLSTRGDLLFDSLINAHGIRDRRNNAINYLVKRKIQELTIMQLTDMTSFGISDFTKWDNLRKLSLVNIGKCDMNMIVLPRSCQLLQIKNVSVLTWFNIGEWDNNEVIQWGLDDNSTESKCHLYHLKQDSQAYLTYRAKLWKSLGSLNGITLSNIGKITNDVFVPRNLYEDLRVKLFTYPQDTKIICI